MPRVRAQRPQLIWLLLVVIVIGAALPPQPSAADPSSPAAAYTIYLPGVAGADTFGSRPGLWSHAGDPAPHEIALIRCVTNLAAPLGDAVLSIFADTRYEAWVNGAFVARGPARFSQVRREFDQVSLGALGAGAQTVAVLAQWAPNQRRSTSVQPQVQLRLRGTLGGEVYARTFGPDECRAVRPQAWNMRPALIHAWGLLGPSEQLDLRALPAGWASPGFDDGAWPRAASRPAEPRIFYQPRSIPASVTVPMPVRLRAGGTLAPGFWVGELGAGAPTTYQFTLAAPTVVTLRALASPGQPAPTTAVALNDTPLTWARVPGGVPDLRTASRQLPAGQHRLSVGNLGEAQAWVFAISRAGINSAPPPLGQGPDPGRRLLIPDLTPSGRTTAVSTTTGLDLTLGPGPAYAILDLGRTVHGRVVAEVSGPAGTLVDIGWDERLWAGARPLPSPGSLHPEWSQADAWVLGAEPRTLTTIDARAGHYVLIAAWGEGTVRLRNLRVLEERYPLALRGSFTSPSDRLNRIWQVGVDTLYPTMVDAYADPWRERGQWWGDASIADHANRVAFGETGLLRRGLSQLADTVTDGQPTAFAPNHDGVSLLDYSMRWVQSARLYGDLTDDREFLTEIYPKIRVVMNDLARRESPETGLIVTGDEGLPWGGVYIDSNSYWDRRGQTTAVNAFYYGTLRDAAAIASSLGYSEEAAAWMARAAQLRTQANRLLYRAAEGRYVAGMLNGLPTEATPQAQAAALAFGLAPAGEEQRVADALLALLGTPERPGAQVLGMFNVLEGLGRTGRIDDGLAVIDRFFGSMLDRGATTWWENFNADKSYAASLSHAWGASPTWFLSTYVLGARRTGATSWEVRLLPSRLTAAAGALPLADGELRVSWSAPTCQALQVTIEAPEGSTGKALIAAGPDDRELRLGDSVVWAGGGGQGGAAALEDQMYRLDLGPGVHTLELRRNCAATGP